MGQAYVSSMIQGQGAQYLMGVNAANPTAANLPPGWAAMSNQQKAFATVQQQAHLSVQQQYQQGIYSGNAQMLAQIGTTGANLTSYGLGNIGAVNFANAPAMQTTFGGSISAEFAQFTGYNMAGQQTGGAWGQQSLQMGSVSGAQMAVNMYGSRGWSTGNLAAAAQGRYGSFGAGYINAQVNGQALANGQVVGGAIGGEQYAANQSYGLQMASVGVGFQQVALQEAFTTGVGIQKYSGTVNPQTGTPFGYNTGNFGFNVGTSNGTYSYQSQGGGSWGLQDAQRYLGYAQTESGFAFQQSGMNLQAQQFKQSMGLQQQQINLGVAQGTEQHQYQMGLTQQQFGFGQTMYHEQARFLSGRERRLAEMQNKETITVHGMEVGQAEKEFGFQKQSWALQEDQHKLQIKQFNETKKLQQDQLDAAIKFYKEEKDLQEESILMDRAQWVNQIAMQRESLGIQAAQIANAKIQADLDREAQTYITNIQSALGALNADTFPNLYQWIMKILNVPIPNNPGFGSHGNGPAAVANAMGGPIGPGDTVGEWGPERVVRTPGGLGVLPAGSDRGTLGVHGFATGTLASYMGRTMISNANSGGPGNNQPVNIFIGNEKLASFVINTVTKEIHK